MSDIRRIHARGSSYRTQHANMSTDSADNDEPDPGYKNYNSSLRALAAANKASAKSMSASSKKDKDKSGKSSSKNSGASNSRKKHTDEELRALYHSPPPAEKSSFKAQRKVVKRTKSPSRSRS